MTAEIRQDFLPKRRAQIYVDILAKKGRTEAGKWAASQIPKDERGVMAPYVIAEKERRGIK